jgi:hypothetical protein
MFSSPGREDDILLPEAHRLQMLGPYTSCKGYPVSLPRVRFGGAKRPVREKTAIELR